MTINNEQIKQLEAKLHAITKLFIEEISYFRRFRDGELTFQEEKEVLKIELKELEDLYIKNQNNENTQ